MPPSSSRRLKMILFVLLLPLLFGGCDLALGTLFEWSPPDWPWYGYVWRAYGLGVLIIGGEVLSEWLEAWSERRRERRAVDTLIQGLDNGPRRRRNRGGRPR